MPDDPTSQAFLVFGSLMAMNHMQDGRKLQLLESLVNTPAELHEFIGSPEELNHLIQEGLVEILNPLYPVSPPYLRITGEGVLVTNDLRRLLGIPDPPHPKERRPR